MMIAKIFILTLLLYIDWKCSFQLTHLPISFSPNLLISLHFYLFISYLISLYPHLALYPYYHTSIFSSPQYSISTSLHFSSLHLLISIFPPLHVFFSPFFPFSVSPSLHLNIFQVCISVSPYLHIFFPISTVHSSFHFISYLISLSPPFLHFFIYPTFHLSLTQFAIPPSTNLHFSIFPFFYDSSILQPLHQAQVSF